MLCRFHNSRNWSATFQRLTRSIDQREKMMAAMKKLEKSEDEGEISNHQAKLEEVMAEITEENKIAVELGACDSHVEVKRQTDLSRYVNKWMARKKVRTRLY